MSVDTFGSTKFIFRAVYSVTLYCLAITFGNVNASSGTYCYKTDPNPYVRFGTSSSYELNFPNPNLQIDQNHDGCAPVQAYGVVRVGARYFSNYKTDHLIELKNKILENSGSNLTAPDMELMRSWSSKGEGKTSDDIAPQGVIEVSHLGERIAAVFKKLGATGPENYKFFQTSNPTSRDSAKAFVEGMFGKGANVQIKNNETLRFLEETPSLQTKLTEPALEMRKVCESSDPIQKLVKEVSRDRLGFAEDLPIDSIADMYFACAFETAWAPHERSAFCAPFTKEHLKLLEYCYMDVFGYYEWGYGSKHAHNPIVDDLYQKFVDRTLQKPGEAETLHADFSIVSGAALTHTISRVGLYREQVNLPVDCEKEKHIWSMTDICPFAGNFIAVLHKCQSNGQDQYKVSFYHNERRVKIPDCATEHCNWSEFHIAMKVNNQFTPH